MTLTATFDPSLARVQLTVSGVGTAIAATFERSIDNGTTWTTIRCGDDTPIVSGTASIYDYEFSSNVLNSYRVTSYSTVTFVNAGTAAHGNNASVLPGLPASMLAGDAMLIFAAIRGTAASVTTPTGYTLLASYGNVRLFGKTHSGVESGPTVAFTGGAAGDDTSAQMAAFRGASLNVIASAASLLTPTTQNIPFPGLTLTQSRCLKLWLGWKADDWTSVATIGGATEIGEPSTTTGNDQGIVWDYKIEASSDPSNVAAGSFSITGGATATATGANVALDPVSTVQTTSITPIITDLWIKSIGKPFLNRTVYCLATVSDIEREPRHAIFEIINRSFPVAVTDLHQSRQGSIRVVTRTRTEANELDLIIASGEPLFFHTPLNHPLPTMHVVLGHTKMQRPLRNPTCDETDWRVFELPWREIAAPSTDVCGSTITWQGVINAYATWQAVINAETSWIDLLTNIGTPGDIIVP